MKYTNQQHISVKDPKLAELWGGYMRAEAAWSGQSNFEVFETSERSQAGMFPGPSTSFAHGVSVLDWMSKSFFLSQVSTAKLRSDAIRSLHITKRLRWKSVSNALPDSVPVRTGSDMREWMYHRAMPWTLECKHKYTCASFKILVQQMCGYETQAFRRTR